MTAEQIKRDYAEHQKILRKAAFRHEPGCPGVVLTANQARSLDAANSAAAKVDDPESDPSYGRRRTLTQRLYMGLSMMERYGIDAAA